MKANDLYLSYVSNDYKYCEIGYTFKKKCRKIKKNCQTDLKTCILCK